jgi:hypothetical protein
MTFFNSSSGDRPFQWKCTFDHILKVLAKIVAKKLNFSLRTSLTRLTPTRCPYRIHVEQKKVPLRSFKHVRVEV